MPSGVYERKNKITIPMKERRRVYKQTYHLKHRDRELARLKVWRDAHKEERRAYRVKYYQEHKDTEAKNRRRWFQENKEKIYVNHKKWYLKNREKMLIYQKDIRIKNRESILASKHTNRAKRKNAGELSIKTIQMVYEDNIKQYGTLTCYLCLKPIEFKRDSLEHRTPICKGGTNEYHNLAIAHINCNRAKNRKTYEEYMKEVSNA